MIREFNFEDEENEGQMSVSEAGKMEEEARKREGYSELDKKADHQAKQMAGEAKKHEKMHEKMKDKNKE